MNKHFEMSDLGKLSYYLGIEVDQQKCYVKLKQTSYANKVLEKAGMKDCNPTKIPMEHKVLLTKDKSGAAIDSTEYKSIVGGLHYLVHTRSDISYAVGIISRFMERPTVMHMNAARRIMCYIKRTLGYDLSYSKDSGNYILTGFSESDLDGHIDDRRSTSGIIFYLNMSVIIWVL